MQEEISDGSFDEQCAKAQIFADTAPHEPGL
jgi:hypothetical protein